MDMIFSKTRHNDITHALNTLSEKSKVVAQNIANADTPMYKSGKLVFSEVMQEYFSSSSTANLRKSSPAHIGSQSSSNSKLAVTNSRHIQISPTEDSITAHVRHQNNPSLRTDGNDVNLDYEMSEQASTSILYSMLSEIAGGKFATLKEIVRTR